MDLRKIDILCQNYYLVSAITRLTARHTTVKDKFGSVTQIIKVLRQIRVGLKIVYRVLTIRGFQNQASTQLR